MHMKIFLAVLCLFVFLSLMCIYNSEYIRTNLTPKSAMGNTSVLVHVVKKIVQKIADIGNEQVVIGDTDERLVKIMDASLFMPLRGPGDSFLPFPHNNSHNAFQPPKDLLQDRSSKGLNMSNSTDPPLKTIMLWNDLYYDKSFYFGIGREPFLQAGCRVNTCQTVTDRKKYTPEELDAVMWHVRSFDKSFPPRRSRHTRYIYVTVEPPWLTFVDLNKYKDFFNWTFSYKSDSDFAQPYGVLYRRHVPLPIPEDKNYASGKTKLAAWFVSHCHTHGGREVLVKTLQQWIPVDVYGGCGPLKCDKKQQKDTCYQLLQKDYKFYMSFENALCMDYATEKIFEILRLDILPVVYGLANYSSTVPPHSYVDALDFPTAKDLADHILYLDKNDTAYNEYFQWKRYHQFSNFTYGSPKAWCELCERLHYDHMPKVYDLYQWFIEGSHCLDYNSPGIARFIKGLPPLQTTNVTSTKKVPR